MDFTIRGAKVSVVVETPATGTVPVPVRLTVCVLPGTPLLLSVMVRVPLRVPGAVGVKVNLISQVPLAATGVPVLQVVPLASTAKSPAAAMPVKVRGVVPSLVTVTVFAPLVVPSG